MFLLICSAFIMNHGNLKWFTENRKWPRYVYTIFLNKICLGPAKKMFAGQLLRKFNKEFSPHLILSLSSATIPREFSQDLGTFGSAGDPGNLLENSWGISLDSGNLFGNYIISPIMLFFLLL